MLLHVHSRICEIKQIFLPGKDKRNDMFGNFDPNAFNAQAGASFNPNAVNGGSGSSTGGMSMFNPNAMMGGGGSTTGGEKAFSVYNQYNQ